MPRIKSGLASPTLLLVIFSVFGLSQVAQAAPCTDQVDALKAAMNDNGICQYSKACKGLSHKLDNANRKLEKGKFRHAARKLADFGAIVGDMAMRRKPKISMADYEALMEPYFNAAAICVANGGVVDSSPEPEPTDEGSTNDDGGGFEAPTVAF
jgi:hypothetical protein